MLSRALYQLGFGFRVLRRDPEFTIVAVLILGLGIGANTAIFSVVNALLLRSLPLQDPGRLVYLSAYDPSRHLSGGGISLTAYETLRDGNRSFTGITAFVGGGFILTGAGDPESLSAARVSPNFFDVLGAHPVLGRGFRPDEGDEGSRPLAVISHSLWSRRFSSDPNIVGKPVTLGQEVYTIIGVAPSAFPFPFPGVDVWVSRIIKYGGLQPEQIRAGAGMLTAIARLRSGISASQAEAEAAVLAQQYRQGHANAPDADPHRRLEVVDLHESLVTGIKTALLILMGAVGMVLLIACANVASLTLARATGRAREIAIRAALGASRGDLLRQLVGESLLLSASGAALGILIARFGIDGLVKVDAGNNLPGIQPIRMDLEVLAFTLLVSVVSAILFGLMPALQLSRPDLNTVLRDSGWGTTAGAHRHRRRSLLVAAQMALSIVLLIGAALLLESFRNLQRVDPGFNPQGVLTMNVNLPPAKYPDNQRRSQFFRELVQRIASQPGVISASASYSRPVGSFVMSPILADGQPIVPIGQRPLAEWNGTTPGYFRTFGIPLLRGRDFTWSDNENSPRVVIVNQSLASHFWPRENPLGKHLTFTRLQTPFEIVGVAGNTHNNGLQSDPGMVIYTPYPQWTIPTIAVSLRTAGDPHLLGRVATAQVQALDRDQPVTGLQTAGELLENQMAQSREILYMIGGFAVVSLILAITGLYGSMAYSVAQRTVEIGIRQAVGACRGDILRLVVLQAFRLALIGTCAGVLAAVFVTRLLSTLLFQVRPTDPAAFSGIALLFLAVAVLAAIVPAWQATRVDPMKALR
ncbi:MAG TPA: ABC transporter permease [Verrucomicrobiae bacterium]|nr:ABC transporter permease [Verrucomicrobiae bacterium]